MRRYSRDGYVAPNKPITLLWALARIEEGKPRLARFAAAEQELQPLLDAYAQYRTSPVHAFWALQTDGFWEVTWKGEMVPRLQSREPTRTSLRAHASGGLREEVFDLLVSDSALRRAETLTLRGQRQEGLPENLHIPSPAGARETTSRLKRDAFFRVGVMSQFDARCAVCDWSLSRGGRPIGLSGAHVHSLEQGGPDAPGNGFVLCWFHHTLFDAGLFTYDEQRRLVVSSAWREEARGSMPSLLDYVGKLLPEPRDPNWRVKDTHLSWHRDNVFTG